MADAARITRHVWNVNTADPEQNRPISRQAASSTTARPAVKFRPLPVRANRHSFIPSDRQLEVINSKVSGNYSKGPREKLQRSLRDLGRYIMGKRSRTIAYAEAVQVFANECSERSARHWLRRVIEWGLIGRDKGQVWLKDVQYECNGKLAKVTDTAAYFDERKAQRRKAAANRQRLCRHRQTVPILGRKNLTNAGTYENVTLSIRDPGPQGVSFFLPDSLESTKVFERSCPDIPADLLAPVGAKAPHSPLDVVPTSPQPQLTPEAQGTLQKSSDAMTTTQTRTMDLVWDTIEKCRLAAARRDGVQYQPLERSILDHSKDIAASEGSATHSAELQNEQTAKPSAPQAPSVDCSQTPPRPQQKPNSQPQTKQAAISSQSDPVCSAPRNSNVAPMLADTSRMTKDRRIMQLIAFRKNFDPDNAWRLNLSNLHTVGLSIEQSRMAMQMTREAVAERAAKGRTPLENPGGYCIQTARALRRAEQNPKEPTCPTQTDPSSAFKTPWTKACTPPPSRSRPYLGHPTGGSSRRPPSWSTSC